jgi:SAM-dependent methyltransferase
VDILRHGIPIGTTLAEDYREDLAAAGIGDGKHAFWFRLPAGVPSDGVQVRLAGAGLELPRARAAAVPEYRRLTVPLLSGGLWCIEDISVNASTLRFSGWAFHFTDVAPEQCTFQVNGRPCQAREFPMPRTDIRRQFPHVRDSEMAGFCCSTEILPEDGGVFELAFGPASGTHNQYFTVDALPLPEPERRERVHGSRDESTFRLEGFSAYRKLEKALACTGRTFDDCPRILDWGCGCGRVARYFGRQLYGLDIDADNIGWCRRNLPFGTFETIPLHPDPAAPSEKFSLILGISVFTHLSEDVMFEWLDWLNRMLDPDCGLAMVSVHSDFWWARNPHMPQEAYDEWRRRGILDRMSNAALDPVLPPKDRSYYRTTFHTHEYLRAKWSPCFDILEILPGYIGNQQDLVIMRPRGGLASARTGL